MFLRGELETTFHVKQKLEHLRANMEKTQSSRLPSVLALAQLGVFLSHLCPSQRTHRGWNSSGSASRRRGLILGGGVEYASVLDSPLLPQNYPCKPQQDTELDQNEAQEGTGFMNLDALLSKVRREDTKAVLSTKQMH